MIGILLTNIGTPDAPTVSSIRHFLKEFLSDPRVLDIPVIARWLLVHGIIAPFRPYKIVHAYQAIWHGETSPLLHHSKQLQQTIAKKLGNKYVVALGMRYGNPSIASAITQLINAKCDHIVVLPLFPQYACASTGTVIENVLTIFKQQRTIPSINIRSNFYDHPSFIDAYVQVIKGSLGNFIPELFLFSYHGLPERQLKNQTPRFCYRTQCFTTTELIAQALHLFPHQYQTCFQSRLGRVRWIKPYTDEVLIEIAKRGIKNIVVVCPSFVADCLETLEEIGIRARAMWQQLGGEQLHLVPCLNAHPVWVDAVIEILQMS